MITIKQLQKQYKIRDTSSNLIKQFLHPQYKTIHALEAINTTIEDGEVIGILGANGAGKSTLIKLLCGILTPTSGYIEVNHFTPAKRETAFLKQIGLMMGNRSALQYDLPIKDSLEYAKVIYEVNDSVFDAELAKFTETIGLQEYLNTPVRKLSLGQRKKAELLVSIVHNPKLLFLDEPTLGLDIKSKKEMLDFIRYLNHTYQTTVVLTTHDISDMEELCQRIVYIEKGAMVYDGPTASFGNADTYRKVHVVFQSDIQMEKLKEICIHVTENAARDYQLLLDKDRLSAFLHAIYKEDVSEMSITKISLEEAVLAYEKHRG